MTNDEVLEEGQYLVQSEMFTTKYCGLSRKNQPCEKKYLPPFFHGFGSEPPTPDSLLFFSLLLEEGLFWNGLRGVPRRRLTIPQVLSSTILKGMASIFGSSRFPFTS